MPMIQLAEKLLLFNETRQFYCEYKMAVLLRKPNGSFTAHK